MRVLLRSANILTERDPKKISWSTLPDGDVGIRAPKGGGTIAEEQSFSVMADGSLFCVFRTIDGHAAHTYSRDGGHTWTKLNVPIAEECSIGQPFGGLATMARRLEILSASFRKALYSARGSDGLTPASAMISVGVPSARMEPPSSTRM